LGIHDNYTADFSGENNRVLTITNTNNSQADLSFSNISVSNNNIKKNITETILCVAGGISYSLSGASTIEFNSSLVITANTSHLSGNFT
jgi:hypothetical protein